MNKHTPGPWDAHHHESTDTYTIHVAGRSWESWAIAHVGDCTQDEANARLIAAAPDLLDALRQWAAAERDSDMEEMANAIRSRDAAISKATGEAI